MKERFKLYQENRRSDNQVEQLGPSRFPDGFSHVANIQAGSLTEVMWLIWNDQDSRKCESDNPRVEVITGPIGAKDGDVIVSPDGTAYRIVGSNPLFLDFTKLP